MRSQAAPLPNRPHYTLEQQTQIFDEFANTASHILAGFCILHRDAIITLARERLIGTGFADYGDAMFHQTPTENLRETLEEAADMLNRLVVKTWRLDANPAPGEPYANARGIPYQ